MDSSACHYHLCTKTKRCAKIPRIIQVVSFLLFVLCLQVQAKELEQSVSISKKEVSLEEVFREIKKQTGYTFVYKEALLKKAKKVSVSFSGATVRQVLDECLKNQRLTYAIVNKMVVIKDQELIVPASYVYTSPPPLNISGKVTNENGEPLQGVSVVIAGSKKGTTTNRDGAFVLNVPNAENLALEVSFVGFQTKTIKVGRQTEIVITLAKAVAGLDDVVVVGYGTRSKRDLTGSVSQVKTQQLEAAPVYSIGEALKGQSSGVQVTNNSAAPGARIQVRIRGGNSMIGSNTPLFVVDGFPLTGGIEFLNPSDIESINILKDASATAIYGSRGANGVVIITSKRGKTGQRGQISINSYYGQQEVAKRFEVLNPKQYAVVANEWMKNSNLAPYFNVDTVKAEGTDWQDVIFRVAPIQNHTVSFSGSSDKTRYSLSGNYYQQEGVIFNSGIKRGSLRLNLDHDIKDWLTISENLTLSRREQFSVPVENGSRGNTVFSGALSAPPTLSPYEANGTFTRIEQKYPFVDPTDMRNPLIYSKPYKNRNLANSVLANTALTIKLMQGLSIKTLLGVEYQNAAGDAFTPIIFTGDRGSASASQSYLNSFLNENTITYARNLRNGQNLEVTGGFTYQTNVNSNSGISVSGFPNNITENYSLGSASTVSPPTSGISEWKLASFLGRVNYTINQKYYFTASFRADGSSRFGKDNKWGYFPSGAFAWRMSDERFMDNIKFISNLKLRTSYGITGNTALSPYQSLDRLSGVRYIDGGQAETIGFAPSGIANSKLKWETYRPVGPGVRCGNSERQAYFHF